MMRRIGQDTTSVGELRLTVDRFMVLEMEKLRIDVPSAAWLTDEMVDWSHSYYVRHLIETVKRIRMTSRTDALALAAMVDEDYQAARWWSRYIAEELSHDILFLKDLEQHGVSPRNIAAVSPFSSTVAMVAFMEARIQSFGSLAGVAYSVWVEWNSEKSSAAVAQRAAQQYGPQFVRGTIAHVGVDETQDHLQTMLDVVHRLIRHPQDELMFFDMLCRLTMFAAGYFRELERETRTEPNRRTISPKRLRSGQRRIASRV